jgi:proteasome beta subunit
VSGFYESAMGQSAAFMSARMPSFTDFLASYSPDLLPPGFRGVGFPHGGALGGADNEVIKNLPHATTIVAVACERGVVIAGDRRATAGNMISKRDVDKVFRSDEFSAMAIAGVMAIGLEFVRLFQVELEHYEKMEGRTLSLEGKAHRLGKMVRDNLIPAMQASPSSRCSPVTTRWPGSAGSSATTWRAARTRSTGSTPSGPARSSRSRR